MIAFIGAVLIIALIIFLCSNKEQMKDIAPAFYLKNLQDFDMFCESLDRKMPKGKYESICWNCHSTVDAKKSLRCPKCDWYICNVCGSCSKNGCNTGAGYKVVSKFNTAQKQELWKLLKNEYPNTTSMAREQFIDAAYDMKRIKAVCKKVPMLKYDEDGFDPFGYDKEGYNRQGFNAAGYNRYGYNKQGRNRQGYDKNGYNVLGFDKDGKDRFGQTKEEVELARKRLEERRTIRLAEINATLKIEQEEREKQEKLIRKEKEKLEQERQLRELAEQGRIKKGKKDLVEKQKNGQLSIGNILGHKEYGSVRIDNIIGDRFVLHGIEDFSILKVETIDKVLSDYWYERDR